MRKKKQKRNKINDKEEALVENLLHDKPLLYKPKSKRFIIDSWSLLNKTIPDLFVLSDSVINSAWESADQRKMDALLISETRWDQLLAKSIYKEDPLSFCFSTNIDYFLQLDPSGELFHAGLSLFQTIVKPFIKNEELTLGTISDSPILPQEELMLFAGYRLNSFSLPVNILSDMQQDNIFFWKDLFKFSEISIITDIGFTWQAIQKINLIWEMRKFLYMFTLKLKNLIHLDTILLT